VDLGLGEAAQGLDAAQGSLSVWANDLANSQTAAFPQAIPIEGEGLETPLAAPVWPGVARQTPALLDLGSGAALVATQETFAGGAPEETGVSTDLALEGAGFFVVKTPAGRAYTRDGSFSVDGEGRLVTSSGDFVLGTNGQPIRAGSSTVTIAPDGTVTTSDGKTAGRIALATFPNPQGLVAAGNGLYVQGPDSGPARIGTSPAGTRMLQGMLASSGTDVAQALTGVIDAAQSFDLNVKSLGQSSRLLSWAAGLT